MRKISFLLFTLCCYNYALSYGNLGIKQRFDAVYTELFGKIYNINLPVSDIVNDIDQQGQAQWENNYPLTYYQNSGDQDVLGSTRSSSLEALLRMYEATCEIKYLYEFMQEAAQITNMRSDKVGQSGGTNPWKYWFINSVYYHGRILHGFTHYVHLVKSNTNLYNTVIPLAHRPNFANHSTFGAYAEWLNTNNMQTMNFLRDRYWRGADECMCKPVTISEGTSCKTKESQDAIMEMNMQAAFGCAFIYLYLANPTVTDYAVKSVEMARAYLVAHGNVLIFDGDYNRYKWYHSGWQQVDNVLRNNYFEDIGHAAYDLMFPLLYNKYASNFYPSITGGQYFGDYQLVRFRNAFTKIIYNATAVSTCNSLQTTFDCNVFGGCMGHYYGDNPPVSPPMPDPYTRYQMNAKNWAAFYLFDNDPNAQPGAKVYDILMNYYINVESCLPITLDNYGGAAMIGLADLVVANYDMENILCGAVVIGPKEKAYTSMPKTSVSPNPANTQVQINSDKPVKEVMLVDFTGREVLRLKNQVQVNVEKLENGTYTLHIWFDDNTSQIEKLVVSH